MDHRYAGQSVSFQETLVVGESANFAGRPDFTVGGGSGSEFVAVAAEAALGAADKFGVAGDDGGDGVFEGRHAAHIRADGLDGGGHRAVSDGGAGMAAMATATDGVAGIGGAGGVAGFGGGAGEAGDFVGGSGQVEDGGQGVGLGEGSQVAAPELAAKDGVGEAIWETTGGVVAESAVYGQGGGGVGGGAADGVHGVGQAVDKGIHGAGGVGPKVAGAAMAASVASRAWRSRASLRDGGVGWFP